MFMFALNNVCTAAGHVTSVDLPVYKVRVLNEPRQQLLMQTMAGCKNAAFALLQLPPKFFSI